MVKKKDIGNVVAVDIHTDPPKPKREISEAQKNNLKKGMAILKAKREGLRKEQEEESSKSVSPPVVAPVVAPVVIEPVSTQEVKVKRTVKPKKEPVGLDEFNTFKNEVLQKLQPKEVIKEVSVEKIVDRPVVTEKVVTKERFVSGSELLNRLFFN